MYQNFIDALQNIMQRRKKEDRK